MATSLTTRHARRLTNTTRTWQSRCLGRSRQTGHFAPQAFAWFAFFKSVSTLNSADARSARLATPHALREESTAEYARMSRRRDTSRLELLLASGHFDTEKIQMTSILSRVAATIKGWQVGGSNGLGLALHRSSTMPPRDSRQAEVEGTPPAGQISPRPCPCPAWMWLWRAGAVRDRALRKPEKRRAWRGRCTIRSRNRHRGVLRTARRFPSPAGCGRR